MEPELYELDVSGTEEEAIEREWKRAQARELVSLWHVVAPLVRTIIALVVAMGAKSVREALARAKRVFAPVDVEADLKRLVDGIRSEPPPAALRTWIGPLVEDRARLAREVERLRGDIAVDEKAFDKVNADRMMALGDIAKLTDALGNVEGANILNRNALKQARAEIAGLTASRDNLQSEVSMLTGGLNDIFGKGAHPAPREALEQVSGLVRKLRTAPPGEAWDRLCNAVGCLRGWPDEDIADAVKAFDEYRAAVEPRGRGVYIASKAKHGPRWIALRDSGVPIASTWIDEFGEGQTSDWPGLWDRSIAEASGAAALVMYVEEGEIHKGSLVEVGAALHAGVPVFWVGPEVGTVRRHRLVTVCETLDDAIHAAGATVEPRGAVPTIAQLEYTATASTAQPVTVAVEPLTEDEKREAHRFGKVTGIGFARAQEAIAETKAKRAADAREVIASAPGQIGPGQAPIGDEVTDAELAEVVRADAFLRAAMTRRGDSNEEVVARTVIAEIAPRLARAEQAHRAAPAMTADRAREVAGDRPASRPYVATERQRERSEAYATFERMGQRECDVIEWLSDNYEPLKRRAIEASKAAREAATPTPTPPRALTEAEARGWADRLAEQLDDLDLDGPIGRRDILAAALLAANRGEVPPEVRLAPGKWTLPPRAMTEADMLGAIDAAERAYLTHHRWTKDGRFWIDPHDGCAWPSASAISVQRDRGDVPEKTV